MNSQGESAPDFTIAPIDSMMWVCGEIGYAQTTSGLHAATASATAREPSIWRNTIQPVPCRHESIRGRGGGRIVLVTDHARVALADRRAECVE